MGPRGEVTILCAEIEGFAELNAIGDRAISASLRLYAMILQSEVARHNGYQVRNADGAVEIAFGTALGACKFAVALQQSLAQAEWPRALAQHVRMPSVSTTSALSPPQRPRQASTNSGLLFDSVAMALRARNGMDAGSVNGLRVRIGFNTGEPRREDSTTGRAVYSGADVALALGVCQIAAGGQVLLTAATMSAMLPLHMDLVNMHDAPPFGMVTGNRISFTTGQCWLEYMGLCNISGSRGQAECIFSVIPYGLDQRCFRPIADAVSALHDRNGTTPPSGDGM